MKYITSYIDNNYIYKFCWVLVRAVWNLNVLLFVITTEHIWQFGCAKGPKKAIVYLSYTSEIKQESLSQIYEPYTRILTWMDTNVTSRLR